MKRRVLFKNIGTKVIDEEYNQAHRADIARKEEVLMSKTLEALHQPSSVCTKTLQI
jgi:hypothetical protein